MKNALAMLTAITVATIAPAALEGAVKPAHETGGGVRLISQSAPEGLYEAVSAIPEAEDASGLNVVEGKVVKVADGDTLTVLDSSSTQYKIRLNAIDAPEKDQAFGKKSKERLSSLVYGKRVQVEWKSVDKYGRLLGTVYAGGSDVNLQMLRDGYAWHYKRFDSNPVYAAAENEARQKKRGLWRDPNPVPPEDFRHGKTGAPQTMETRTPAAPQSTETRTPAALNQTAPSTLLPRSARVEYRAGNKMPVGSRTAAPVNSTWPDTGFWLSTNSDKRHNRNCENYRKTRGYPCTSSEGTPCGKCGG